jgi:IclR family KDG regulon transcriptional repressor
MLSDVITKRAKSAHSRGRSETQLSEGGKYSVSVVRSTFRVLEQLSRSEVLGLNEITRKTGIAKSTVFRILSTLVELGYVLREENRAFRISPTLGDLVSEKAAHETLRFLAVPLMLELRNQYGETVNLGVRHFEKVTYLEVVPSEFALRLEEIRGHSVPAHCSALGKAILAFSPQNIVEDLVRGQELEIVTQNTISNPDEFLTEIKRVRNAGFAFDRGEHSLLAVCVGAPILGSHGNAVAAMSISGPASRFNPKKDSPVIASLLKATAQLSGRLAKSTVRPRT